MLVVMTLGEHYVAVNSAVKVSCNESDKKWHASSDVLADRNSNRPSAGKLVACDGNRHSAPRRSVEFEALFCFGVEVILVDRHSINEVIRREKTVGAAYFGMVRCSVAMLRLRGMLRVS